MGKTNHDIEFKMGYEVKPQSLKAYYRIMYPQRVEFLEQNRNWLYNGYKKNEKLPVVILLKDEVIAHGGMIQVDLDVNQTKINAGWLVDLSVHPRYQRQGLGTQVVNMRSKLADIQMAFPNEKSYGVFRKKAWNENLKTYLHYVFIKPFNHPRFKQKIPAFLVSILNFLYYPVYAIIHKRRTIDSQGVVLKMVSDMSVREIYDLYKVNRNETKDIIRPVRDLSYLSWRILQSPNRNRYRIYIRNNFASVISFRNSSRVDVLWITDIKNKKEIKIMINYLAVIGMKTGQSYLRFFTPDPNVSGYLKWRLLSYVSHPRFLFNSEDKEISRNLSSGKWDIQLIDSDFEFNV